MSAQVIRPPQFAPPPPRRSINEIVVDIAEASVDLTLCCDDYLSGLRDREIAAAVAGAYWERIGRLCDELLSGGR